MDIKDLLSPQNTDKEIINDVPYYLKPAYSPASSTSSSPESTYASSLSPSNSPFLKQKYQLKHRLNPQTRTAWSSEEDYLLQKGYQQGLSWAIISATYLPHRSRGCCWGRFKTIRAKTTEERGWSDHEDRILLLTIKKHAKLFEHAWRSVAQDVGHRSWRECEGRSCKFNSILRKKQQQQSY